MMKVLLFGRLADIAGWRERSIAEEGSVSQLIARLTSEDADLGAALVAKGVRVAIDKALIRGDAALAGAGEVAFLPPMSGG